MTPLEKRVRHEKKMVLLFIGLSVSGIVLLPFFFGYIMGDRPPSPPPWGGPHVPDIDLCNDSEGEVSMMLPGVSPQAIHRKVPPGGCRWAGEWFNRHSQRRIEVTETSGKRSIVIVPRRNSDDKLTLRYPRDVQREEAERGANKP